MTLQPQERRLSIVGQQSRWPQAQSASGGLAGLSEFALANIPPKEQRHHMDKGNCGTAAFYT